MRVRGELIPHKYPKLVSASVFEACQSIINAKRTTTEKPPLEQRAKKPYVFRGLIRCGSCGCQVCSDTKKGKYTYLFCTKAKGKDVCDSERIREERALEVVESVLKQIVIPEPLVRKIHERLKSQYDTERNDLRSFAASLQKELQAAQSKLDRLLDLYLAENYSDRL